jgi:hypothetical protein
MISFCAYKRARMMSDEPFILPRFDDIDCVLDSRVAPGVLANVVWFPEFPPCGSVPSVVEGFGFSITRSRAMSAMSCDTGDLFLPPPGLFSNSIANKALPQIDPWVSLA